ncbi:MAG: tripartite tricarboxylate transporter substrate binding protein [Proteobacteria bacterium]|nr:tripartite tricarboxylate transporter substrate binding protein [Pseudomonadota bacterium]
MHRIACPALYLLLALLPGAADVEAATFPTPGTPIQLIVPYAAGGSVDSNARLMAAGLEKQLGVPVQVVNKPGAASQLALSQLVKTRPNGHTLSYAVLPTVVTHYLDPERDAPYTRKNFQPIALQYHVPAVLAVQTASPYPTLRDLVAAAKAKPESITISDSGLLGTPHMTVLVLEQVAGVRFASVHFDGGAPSVTALLGGHVEVLAGTIPDAVQNMKAGKFRVLGIADDRTSEFLPGVETMRSQGYDVLIASSTGIVAPAGTPKDVVDVLTNAVKTVIASEEVKKRTYEFGVTPRYMNPDEYAAYWEQQEARLGPLLKALRAK